jgi:hypothetical protein
MDPAMAAWHVMSGEALRGYYMCDWSVGSARTPSDAIRVCVQIPSFSTHKESQRAPYLPSLLHLMTM